MESAGYSGTPLWKKLGVKTGQTVFFCNPPENFDELLGEMPEGVRFVKRVRNPIDYVHIFAKSSLDLRRAVSKYLPKIKSDGMIWVSWYKKASKIPTDITEDTIRAICLPVGLVDVKVCAIDKKWSGLKLVIRKELRK